jgi:soluble P-type ATPase
VGRLVASGEHGLSAFIEIHIAGWGNMEIENIALDLKTVKVYVLTADTQGTASEEISDMEAELLKVSEEDSAEVKLRVLKSFAPEKTVVIGNGNNDHLTLREIALGIAVLGDEGMSVSTMKHADILVKNISDAIDLFLKPKRLIATLRG